MKNAELIKAAFGMLGEPVILTRRELIEYMNPAAVSLAGENKTGKPIGTVLPATITNVQADNYVTSAFICGKSCAVKASCAEDMKIYALSPSENEFYGNTMLYANLRSTLSNLKFISDCITKLAESENNDKLLSYIPYLNRSYFKIKHMLENASLAEVISQGKLTNIPEQIDLATMCRDMIDTVKLIVQRDDISISFNSEEHIYVTADKDLLELSILNLLSNSINHILPGGRIRVSLLKTGSSTIISVDDDGKGIAPDELSMVFENYKSSYALDKASTGTGMGLMIVRGIAELHGGTAIIESRGEGKGTAVRVMIDSVNERRTQMRDTIKPYDENSMTKILTELVDSLSPECYSNLFDD